MDTEKLRVLLTRSEGASIEFKREFYRIHDGTSETKKRQKHEFIKDILSLANGNESVAGEPAYLIIGVDDKAIQADGTRILYDVGEIPLSPKQILEIVNPYCDPPLSDITCETVVLDGKRLFVITILPSPHLHETTQRLEPSSGQSFTEYVVFIRHNESIAIASAKERLSIEQLKRLRFNEAKNVPPVLFGTAIGATVGGITVAPLGERIVGGEQGTAIGAVVGIGVGGLLGHSLGTSYREIREIKRDWHQIPPNWRIPIIGIVTLAEIGLWLVSKKVQQSIRNRIKRVQSSRQV